LASQADDLIDTSPLAEPTNGRVFEPTGFTEEITEDEIQIKLEDAALRANFAPVRA